MINYLIIMFIKCLILTIIFEVIGSLIIGIRNKKDILNIILVNIVTNPLVNTISVFINLKYGVIPRRISLVILEILAIIYEGYIYNKYLKYKKINGYLISFLLNFISYGMGLIIYGF